MSPRDQADAVRLLLQWRALFKKLTTDDEIDVAEIHRISGEILKLEAETDQFIAHGPIGFH